MGESGCGRSAGPAEHEVVQDIHGVLALLAGMVDAAADVEAVLGDVVADQGTRDFLLGLEGVDKAWADHALRLPPTAGKVPRNHLRRNRPALLCNRLNNPQSSASFILMCR
jgi:hypothetical protein